MASPIHTVIQKDDADKPVGTLAFDTVVVDVQASNPAGLASAGKYFSKTYSGRVEAHYVDDTGVVTRLTENGAVAGGGGGGPPAGVFEIDANLLVLDATTTTIHTYTATIVEDRASIVYDVLVTMVGYSGTYATFKTVATFTRFESTITEQEVLHVSGPLRSNPAFNLTFVITGLNIAMRVTGNADETRWRAIGRIQTVEDTWLEA